MTTTTVQPAISVGLDPQAQEIQQPAASADAASTLSTPETPHIYSARVDVISTREGRVLCVADIRGAVSILNTLARKYKARAIIHTGNFGFYEPASLKTISDRTLRHIISNSPTIPSDLKEKLADIESFQDLTKDLIKRSNNSDFILSEFPKLLSGQIRLEVPVYTIWGGCEDVAVLEKIRQAKESAISIKDYENEQTEPERAMLEPQYSIPNLCVLDEYTTRVLEIGKVKLRLLGLGGSFTRHKLLDIGEGKMTISGSEGITWVNLIQMGELLETAIRVYQEDETRVLVANTSPGKETMISQLAMALKADFTISGGLHFRYHSVFSEHSVSENPEAFIAKCEHSKKTFTEFYGPLKQQVEANLDDSLKRAMARALEIAHFLPPPVQAAKLWTGDVYYRAAWHWNLPDAFNGTLVFAIDERVKAETHADGISFARRTGGKVQPERKSYVAPVTTSRTGDIRVSEGTVESGTNHHSPYPLSARGATRGTRGSWGTPAFRGGRGGFGSAKFEKSGPFEKGSISDKSSTYKNFDKFKKDDDASDVKSKAESKTSEPGADDAKGGDDDGDASSSFRGRGRGRGGRGGRKRGDLNGTRRGSAVPRHVSSRTNGDSTEHKGDEKPVKEPKEAKEASSKESAPKEYVAKDTPKEAAKDSAPKESASKETPKEALKETAPKDVAAKEN